MPETKKHLHGNNDSIYACDSQGICNIDAIQKSIEEVSAGHIGAIFGTANQTVSQTMISNSKIHDTTVAPSTDSLVSVALPVKDTAGKWVKKPEDKEADPEDILMSQDDYGYGMRPAAAFLNLYSQVQDVSEPSNYYTEFVIGLDGPSYKFEIDSGSTLIWVQSRMSKRDIIPDGQSAYNVFDSEDYGSDFGLRVARDLSPQTYSYARFQITYNLYQDRFNVGAMVAEGQKIGAVAISSLPKIVRARKLEGILGLGPEDPQDLTAEDLKGPENIFESSYDEPEKPEGETEFQSGDMETVGQKPGELDEETAGGVGEEPDTSHEGNAVPYGDPNNTKSDPTDENPVEQPDLMSAHLIRNLKRQGMIGRAMVTMIGPRVDHKFMPKSESDPTSELPRGYLAIGPTYSEYCEGQVIWCDLLQGKDGSPESNWSKGRWVVKLNQITVNGQVAFENQYALIDTGTAFIITSNQNFQKMIELTHGAQVPGKSVFTYDESSLRDLSFEFDRGSLTLSPEDYTLGTTKSKSRVCSCIMKPPVSNFPKDMWVLGGSFLDNMVTIFDYDHRRIGFANIPDKDFKDFGTSL